ncbi:MAG: LytTR family transcriptional regulator [Dielma fastidiosa]|nr:MAG: LytTR family transcriptional regulator [Dielma fastidiosa]
MLHFHDHLLQLSHFIPLIMQKMVCFILSFSLICLTINGVGLERQMKIWLRKSDKISENNIEIYYNGQNDRSIKQIMKIISLYDTRLKAYDDQHNMFLIPIPLIYYIECVDNKVFIYTKDEVYRSHERFTELKNSYASEGLIQINKNTLVNKIHIQSIQIEKECRRKLFLNNDESLIVNRKYSKQFSI